MNNIIVQIIMNHIFQIYQQSRQTQASHFRWYIFVPLHLILKIESLFYI